MLNSKSLKEHIGENLDEHGFYDEFLITTTNYYQCKEYMINLT